MMHLLIWKILCMKLYNIYRITENTNKNVEKSTNIAVQKKKKIKHELPRNHEEFWPIYKPEKEAALGQDNEEEKKKLERIFDITPTTYDAVMNYL